MRYRFFFVLVGLLLAAMACQPGPAPATQPPAAKPSPVAIQPTSTPAPPPKPVPASTPPAATSPATVAPGAIRGGTFVTALNGDPDTINSSLNFGTTTIVGCKILEGLVSASPDQGQLRPELATRWEIAADGLKYTFHLRQGVLWHDGKPFTSEDVKWSFENANKFHPTGQRWLDKVASIQAPDPQTVVLNMKEPFGPLLTGLPCANGGAISPKHVVPPGGNVRNHQQFNRAPIGTGPFVLKEWRAGDRVVLARNEKYWKPNLPYLDQIVVKVVPDSTSRVLALRAGEVNYIDRLLTKSEDAIRLRNDPKVAIFQGGNTPTFHMVQLNHRRAPLGKPEVRKALAMAIDRDLLLTNIYSGFGRVLQNMIHEGLAVAAAPDVNLVKMYPLDVAAANKMLDDAGLPRKADGSRFQIRLVYEIGRTEWKEVSEVIRANWDKIGVKVVNEPVERAVMLDKVFKKRDFDATLQAYTSLGDPALGVARAFICEGDQDPPNFGNSTGYCRKDVDQLFFEASRIADFEKRREAYRKLQKILAEDLPLLVTIGIEEVGLADKDFDISGPENQTSQAAGWEHVRRIR